MPSYQYEPETAVLVGVITPDQTEQQVQEHLDELAFLADTAGAIVKKQFVQRIETPNPRTFIGQGKI
ncbi:MAG: GTPase HflX, partial [Bacteroidales bacterium]|nr:GTPase HflX [Bacteroidales bacterium]